MLLIRLVVEMQRVDVFKWMLLEVFRVTPPKTTMEGTALDVRSWLYV